MALKTAALRKLQGKVDEALLSSLVAL